MNGKLIDTLDADQRRALENVRAAVARLWARPLHRHYTDHTVTHSERIIALLDALTAGVMATTRRLTHTEVFCLLAAAYVHDIGMQNEKFAGGNIEDIRAQHHGQTAEMIYAVFEDPAHAFAIPLAREPGLVEAVALVAKGHRRVNLAASEYEPFVHGDETVRPQLLAALLRFADELNIDHRRVDLEQMKLLALPVESQLHWWKCHYVGGVSIADEYIRISYRFPLDRPDYEGLIVPLVEGEIRSKHAALEAIFRANAVKVALGPSQVRLMRLVQPLPAEVEALARQWLEDAGGAAQVPQAKTVSPTMDPRPGGQSGETVARDREPQPPPGGTAYHIHIERASGLAIGDGARIEQRLVTPERAPQPLVPSPAPQLPPANLYHDLEILIGDRQRRRYPVHVIISPAGEGEGTFTPPFAEDELQSALARMECGDTDEAFLADFGVRLFAALFTGDVRARYAESVGLTGTDAGLRIRLRLDPPELQEWPWELARDPEKREFLILSKRSLVTRYLHVPRPTPPLEVEPPLRVLVVVAAPRGLAPLDADDEAARIRQALRPLVDKDLVNLSLEPHVTKQSLRQRLLDDAPDVLHYVGHGDLVGDRGALLFEGDGGRADRLDGPTLGTLLKGSHVRLAVLNASLRAREAVPEGLGFAGRRAAFMSLGPALVDAGLGAVVAMQFSMANDSARILAEDFYAMLARFKPVDECVSRAREALLLEVGLDRRDWAAPVLFMRAPDGVMFKRRDA
jgi:hypothetical protein